VRYRRGSAISAVEPLHKPVQMNQSRTRPSRSDGMLPMRATDLARFPPASRPRLLFILDAEEEFDWKAPFSRENVSVTSMSKQGAAQRVFERYGIRPTYAADYAVATQDAGIRPLLELANSGACEIGAQLHAWVTPPFEEELSEHNSFASNLPSHLEFRKAERLTRAIEDHLGCTPKLYRAGRYGAGDATPSILARLGYEIDCSVLPGTPAGNGPDYEGAPAAPYWLAGGRTILEIPVTLRDVGIARNLGSDVYDRLVTPLGRALRGPAIAARLHLLNRIRLTPEGSTLAEAKRLTRSMLAEGHRVFVVSYHTPSLVPGHTPYVRSQKDLDGFLGWLDSYCEFFMAEMRGVPSTPTAVRRWALEMESGAHMTDSMIPAGE